MFIKLWNRFVDKAVLKLFNKNLDFGNFQMRRASELLFYLIGILFAYVLFLFELYFLVGITLMFLILVLLVELDAMKQKLFPKL